MVESMEASHFFQYCPRCGQQYEEGQHREVLACGSCGFNFHLNPAACTAALIVNEKRDKLLLARRAVDPSKGMWDTPGGFVDRVDVSLEQGLRRELQEELGVVAERLEYFASAQDHYQYLGLNQPTICSVFVSSIAEHVDLVAQDDIDALQWFDVKKIPLDDIAFPSIRMVIEQFVATREEG